MAVEILFCAVGLIVLTVAADHLVLGASRLAARMKINPIVVGVVVIGLGTSAPEFLVSGTAAARGDTGIAVGNLIGSNIINLTLVLGLAAMIAVVQVDAAVVHRQTSLALLATTAFAVLGWRGLNFWSGLVLALLLVGAVLTLLRWAKTARVATVTVETAVEATAEPGQGIRVDLLRAAGGLVGVLLGAQILVANASAIATRFGAPQVVIGFTLVALGTSLPELVTTIQAQRRRESELVVGNLFGSNLFNSLGGGAVVGLASGSSHPARASGLYLALMMVTSVLAWSLLARKYQLTRIDGLCLLGAYLLTIPVLLS